MTTGLFLGGQVRMCLGPLGVTAVQCARATGVVPDVGIRLPVLALSVAAATFVVAPVPVGRRLPVLVGGIIGATLGATAFLVLRPLTLDGFDASGAWISIPRPLDPYALLTAVILATLLGTVVMRRVPDVRRVWSARS